MKKQKVAKYVVAAVIFVGLVIVSDRIRSLAGLSRAISATGVCNAKVPRDKLAITLQIRALSGNAAASMRIAQNAADDIVRGIKKIGDKSLEIQTTHVSSYEKTKWEKNTEVRLGIESEIDLEITTDSKDVIIAVLDAPEVKKAQAMPRNMRNFSSRAVIDEATAKCLQVAILDARDKAAAIAAAEGEKLGRLISAQFGAGNPSGGARPFLFRAKSEAFAEESSGDYIQSAEGDLSVSVSATFGIK